MSEKIPYKFKMVLLGESGSGKTSLFERIIYDTFEETLEKKEPTALTSPTDDREPLTMSGPYRNRTKQLLVSGNAVKVRSSTLLRGYLLFLFAGDCVRYRWRRARGLYDVALL